MKKYYFLEAYDTSLDLENAEVISLNPAVSQLLSEKGIPYKIIEDFNNNESPVFSQEDYFFDQLTWFNNIDMLIKDKIFVCGKYSINLAMANYLRLKYVIDMIIISTCSLNSILSSFSLPCELIYVNNGTVVPEDYSIFNFKKNNRFLFDNLLKLFCQKKGISLVAKTLVYPNNLKDKRNFNLNSCHKFKKSIKAIRNIIKYKKMSKIYNFYAFYIKKNIFVMHTGSPDIDIPVLELINAGAHIFIEEEGNIIKEDTILRLKAISISRFVQNEVFLKNIKNQCMLLFNDFKKSTYFISWINRRCPIDVSSVVWPYFKSFFLKDAPYILNEAKKKYDFYLSQRIEYVLARGNTDPHSVAALIAAKYMHGAKSICIQHASFAFEAEVYGVFETETYDFILARDYLSLEFYKNSLALRYRTSCLPLQSSHYFKSLLSYKKTKTKHKNKELVAFVEKKFSSRVRRLGNVAYSVTGYFEKQKKIIDFLGNIPNKRILYKASSQEWSRLSVVRYIKLKKYNNISVSEKSFLKCLKGIDKVIVDYPSGAFFEAAISRKPVLCICPSYLIFQKKARDIFKKSLQHYFSIDEACSLINQFLCSPASEYIVDLPISSESFIDIFKGITT
jgi:hypothetical protein